MRSFLDIESILTHPPRRDGEIIGRSRQGRPIAAMRFGAGPRAVSLIGGCHADEPVGPAMLARLAGWLERLDPAHPALHTFTWHLIPHTNPDGAEANSRWAATEADGRLAGVYDLADYLAHAVREAPGDDVEFGFPRHDGDPVRPENAAVAAWMRAAAPLDLHASFHGMAFAAGPWFLLEPAWIARTADLRESVRERARALGYRLHDIDRGGDKGFHRIDEGFTTRPNAKAMIAHFEALGDFEMAARFRPNSMDHARALGGDPLTLVSEMPLFLAPSKLFLEQPVRPKALDRLRAAAVEGRREVDRIATEIGVRPMPIVDQMRLQLVYLESALEATR